jgi:predicted nuclease of predicted toxin-antitoxin system
MHSFLLDAQLPQRLKVLFAGFGFEAIHTLDLPNRNRTKDTELIRICESEHCILITKDDDFVESYLLYHRPKKLLLLSCGNLGNPDLEALFRTNLPRIAREFEFYDFIELNREDIIIHS